MLAGWKRLTFPVHYPFIFNLFLRKWHWLKTSWGLNRFYNPFRPLCPKVSENCSETLTINNILWNVFVRCNVSMGWRVLSSIESPEKSGKNFRNEKSSYDIWEVKHPFCEEIWLKLLKSEDLRSAPVRKKKLKKKKRDF